MSAPQTEPPVPACPDCDDLQQVITRDDKGRTWVRPCSCAHTHTPSGFPARFAERHYRDFPPELGVAAKAPLPRWFLLLGHPLTTHEAGLLLTRSLADRIQATPRYIDARTAPTTWSTPWTETNTTAALVAIGNVDLRLTPLQRRRLISALPPLEHRTVVMMSQPLTGTDWAELALQLETMNPHTIRL